MKSFDIPAIALRRKTQYDQQGSALLAEGPLSRSCRSDSFQPVGGAPVWSSEETHALVEIPLAPTQVTNVEKHLDVHCVVSCQDRVRLRASVFTHRGQTAQPMIPTINPSLNEFGFSPSAEW